MLLRSPEIGSGQRDPDDDTKDQRQPFGALVKTDADEGLIFCWQLRVNGKAIECGVDNVVEILDHIQIDTPGDCDAECAAREMEASYGCLEVEERFLRRDAADVRPTWPRQRRR